MNSTPLTTSRTSPRPPALESEEGGVFGMNRRAQGRRGFTLIELVVVIALLAILFSVTAPPFFRSLGWARMSGSARALVSMAKFARFHAIMHGRPVFLAIDMVDNRFSLGADPPEGVVFAWMAGGDASWGDDSGYRWGAPTGWGIPGIRCRSRPETAMAAIPMPGTAPVFSAVWRRSRRMMSPRRCGSTPSPSPRANGSMPTGRLSSSCPTEHARSSLSSWKIIGAGVWRYGSIR